jgi:hypothetical protein
MISETIKEIMNNICDQIVLKMCQLGVIIKEPLVRRASLDDYHLCFESFNKKSGNSSSNYAYCNNIFGYGSGNYGVFTSNVNLRNLKDTDSDAMSKHSIFSRPDSIKLSSSLAQKQQEQYLDDSKSYQEIREEGRWNTW